MNALKANTTGFNNTAVGYASLLVNTTGTQNTWQLVNGSIMLSATDHGF